MANSGRNRDDCNYRHDFREGEKKMRTENAQHPKARLNYFIFFGVFIMVAVVVAVPFYSAGSSSAQVAIATSAKQPSLLNTLRMANRPVSSMFLTPSQQPETIATFAANCTTPQSSFTLGETVCAKTNFVNLSYPGGRWVDWILTGTTNTIVSGSRTTTLITTNPQTFTYAPTQTGVYKVEITQDLNGQDVPQTPAVFTVSAAPPQTDPIATYEAPACVVPKTVFVLGET